MDAGVEVGVHLIGGREVKLRYLHRDLLKVYREVSSYLSYTLKGCFLKNLTYMEEICQICSVYHCSLRDFWVADAQSGLGACLLVCGCRVFGCKAGMLWDVRQISRVWWLTWGHFVLQLAWLEQLPSWHLMGWCGIAPVASRPVFCYISIGQFIF